MKQRATDPHSQFNRAIRALELGQYRRALRQLERLIRLTQDNPALQEEIHLAMADALLSLRDLGPATRQAQAALALNSQSQRGHYLLGFIYSVQNKWDLAIPALRQAQQLNPSEAEYFRALGWAMFHQSQTKSEGLALVE